MTIRLNFRTRMEDIPKDVKMLIEDVRRSLQAISGSKLQYALDSLSNSPNPSKCAEVASMLATVKEELEKAQLRTEDCISVLSEFHQISTEKNSSTTSSESPTED